MFYQYIFSELSSADSLDLNVSPYMKAPQQQNYNPYPTLSKNSQSIASSFQQESSENELPSEPQTVVKRKNNKRRKINKSRRRKVKRRPNQKKTIPRKVGHFRIITFLGFDLTMISKSVHCSLAISSDT